MRLRRAVVAAVVVGLAGVGAAAWWWWHPGVELGPWRSGPLPESWAALERQESKWRQEGLTRQPEHVYTPLERISIELPLAVLVSEDTNYFGHGAIDPRALRDVWREWRQEGRLRGGSTISQQVAKNLFLSAEKTLGRKLLELRLAWWLEHQLGKRRVLEIYLNVVEFGGGHLGAEAAARHYFDTSCEKLDALQSASLAAAIPSPGRDNPQTQTRRWEVRRDLILGRMTRVPVLRERLEALCREGLVQER
jgi:monofunctional biosynthetic peptidoglycan transglycosylase